MAKRKRVSDNLEIVKSAMNKTSDKGEFQRLQCVYLADTQPELTAEAIGKIVRLSPHRVKIIHANFRKLGMASIKDKRGGRFREYMSVEEETEFLKPFVKKGKTGALVAIGEVKRAYEAKIGKTVVESTIYRLLNRHEFRKIVPYKRHKKANIEEQETFKKTLPQ